MCVNEVANVWDCVFICTAVRTKEKTTQFASQQFFNCGYVVQQTCQTKYPEQRFYCVPLLFFINNIQ